jgi:Icc-related predicted phosphoesterase
MRVFAVSDVHVDYAFNAKWIANVSTADYRDDVLILAGDVTDVLRSLDWCLSTLVARFRKVLFVPGNHELWVVREVRPKTSLQKLREVIHVVESSGASMKSFHENGVSILPLPGWYDYSFGEPSEELKSVWMDFYACRWPGGFGAAEVDATLAALNDEDVVVGRDKVITFSHFLPRIELIPPFVRAGGRVLDPVLGSTRLERQLRRLNSSMHVYGHSHVNRNIKMDGVSYISNALGYPHETWLAAKRLVCIHDC